MNQSLYTIFSTLNCMIHIISNYCIEKEKVINILEDKVKPTYYTLHLSYSLYPSMNLEIFNSTIINSIHNSRRI